MFVLGLTGSAAMGKSTVAAMFAGFGVPVFDADKAVHELYAGDAAPLVEAAFPGTARGMVVDRDALRARVIGDPAAVAKLEALIHPLVREREAAFRERAAAEGWRMILLDIPLLFETGADKRTDAVVVVSAPEAVQQARLAARGLDPGTITAMLSRQLPDAVKRGRAHFVIDTGGALAATRGGVAGVMKAVAGMRGS